MSRPVLGPPVRARDRAITLIYFAPPSPRPGGARTRLAKWPNVAGATRLGDDWILSATAKRGVRERVGAAVLLSPYFLKHS